MALSVIGTGPSGYSTTGGQSSPLITYSFFSGELTTSDSFEDNILDFGISLFQVYIVNVGSNMIAFQFPEKYITTTPPTAPNVASGIVLPNDKILLSHINKKGLKLRSATAGQQSTFVVFGI